MVGATTNHGVDLEKTATMDKTDTTKGSIHQGVDMSVVAAGADLIYNKKVTIMNQAIIDIGMGPFQWKIYIMTGFGWFVDNFWMQAITIVSAPVRNEFNVERIVFLTVAKYAGLVVGSSFWPITADYIGRRLAFNITLLIAAVASLVGAGSPDFVAIANFCAFIGMGSGGNQPVDSAIFLEFIPATHQYLLVMQSAFWSLGQAIAAMIALPLIANYCCQSDATQCKYHDNLGWRYTFWTFGGLTLLLFLIRLTFRVPETPKFLLGKGRDAEAVVVIQEIARRNGGTTWLTLEHFENIDRELGATYAIQAVCGIPASLVGGLTVDMKRIGRKGTGTFACVGTGVFLFPAPIRGTGNGAVAVFNRMSGLMAPIIAAYVGIGNDMPVWISAALFVVAGFVFLILPYETRGKAAI
ncbi:membrane transporter [Fusarium denticulatum]|uniref:Membrane transporter n=1 Tax=Fusarium denticulatum TaxID=48507 RepID=A0A8H6CT73_9HYPO|nr:membrane transporter [Fusarium denticulatum]